MQRMLPKKDNHDEFTIASMVKDVSKLPDGDSMKFLTEDNQAISFVHSKFPGSEYVYCFLC